MLKKVWEKGVPSSLKLRRDKGVLAARYSCELLRSRRFGPPQLPSPLFFDLCRELRLFENGVRGVFFMAFEQLTAEPVEENAVGDTGKSP